LPEVVAGVGEENFSMHHNRVLVADMRPEMKLILCCARLRLDPERTEKIKALLQEGLDWDYLLRAATLHGMAPLLYRHLKTTGRQLIPAAAWESLRQEILNNAAWNLTLSRELFNILSLFESHEIVAIPFKGPALAAFTYGNIALRQFIDLDLLVRREDVLRAKDLLISQGYRPELSMTGAIERAFLRSGYHYGLIHEAKGLLVELHWQLEPHYYSSSVGAWRFWGQVERRLWDGHWVPVLRSEDLLLLLCLHGDKHIWERLAWLCDVAILLEVELEIDWEKVITSASALRSERKLFVGLLIAFELMEASIPEAVMRRVEKDLTAQTLARDIINRLGRGVDGTIGRREYMAYHLKVRQGFRDKARFLNIMFTPDVKDFELVTLPRALHFLYYVLRPMRLIGKYLFNREEYR
jgi:hypothetical protein